MDKLLFIFVVLSCYLGRVTSRIGTEVPSSLIKTGEKCERDHQCIKNAYCLMQTSCVCDNHYFASADNSMCHAAAGLPCKSNDTCNTMANGECVDGTCRCKENYHLDQTNSSNCFSKPSRNGDFCQETIQCVESIDKAICINNKCKCLGSHRFVNETGKCILTRGIYGICLHDYECFDEKISDVLRCISGECASTARAVDDEPDEGSALVASLLTIGLSLVFFIIIH